MIYTKVNFVTKHRIKPGNTALKDIEENVVFEKDKNIIQMG